MESVVESKAKTDWFVEARFGMFIHWGLYAMPARHEKMRHRDRVSTEDYQKYFELFDPDLYNPKEWARMAREAGMKYFVITAKHHEGFCLWDSEFTDYKATNTPYGKDLLKPMVDAFRAEGLKIGLYYSLLDWHHPDFTIDRAHPMSDNQEERAKNADRDMRRYAQYMRDQTRELLTRFGKVDIVWFDFSYPGEDGKGRDDWESEKLVALIRELQPEVMIDNRLDLPEVGDFKTPEQVQPQAALTDENGKPVIWETCQTFSGSWGYYRDETTWREPTELLHSLIDCVSKGGNLLLNVGPTARGEFDPRAQERLKTFAVWMQQNARSIHGCGAAPAEFKCPPGCKLTYNEKKKRLYVHILAWPYKHIALEGDAYMERAKYAQFLHDASEVEFKGLDPWQTAHGAAAVLEPTLYMSIPLVKPPVEFPVIEIYLK